MANTPSDAGARSDPWLPVRVAVRLAAVFALVAGVLAACRAPLPRAPEPTPPVAEATAFVPAARAPRLDPTRVHVLVINGGAEPPVNYQSHLIHVRAMLAWLATTGVPRDRITVFSSDGEDPGADLAVRELRPAGDAELLDGTRFDARFGRPIEYVSTSIEGVPLRPATRASLDQWFATEGKQLRPGDTLLLYVTDHGTRGKTGPEDSRISLWGKGESISVRELDTDLANLDPGVRVLALMSECFSGGFARLGRSARGDGEVLPTGRVCGYFSSTADRPAYGCYPENRGKNNVGHSVRFIEALSQAGDFPASHANTLFLDRTPDVPLRTSDVQLELLLDEAAKRAGQKPDAFADELLAEAWRDPAKWEPDIRLLDRIGQSFGFASARSVAEVDERLAELPQVGDPVKRYAGAWRESLNDLSQANLDRFLAAEPDWRKKTSDEATRGMDAPQLVAIGDALVADLGPFTRGDATTSRRLDVLRDRTKQASGVSYRMEVREAALLRMRAVLLGVAGRVYLATRATPEARAAFEKLEACEEVALRPQSSAGRPPIELAAEPDLPPYADDLRVAAEVAPAWMGIQFQPVALAEARKNAAASAGEVVASAATATVTVTAEAKAPAASGHTKADRALPAGAVNVREVMPDSPAERAGLEVGDVILGPPGKHFDEPRQVREWTMLLAVGEPAPLEILRDGKLVKRTLVPAVHPGKAVEVPAPPAIGSAAPPLEVEPYRGESPKQLADGKDHLLFFWATWCLPCKASLPEVVAFARERGAQVIAITDEDRETLDGFFGSFGKEFPSTVARDARRRTFRKFGVSGTPTFVLIDGNGVVKSYSSGYSMAKGIGVPGWKWERVKTADAAPTAPPGGAP